MVEIKLILQRCFIKMGELNVKNARIIIKGKLYLQLFSFIELFSWTMYTVWIRYAVTALYAIIPSLLLIYEKVCLVFVRIFCSRFMICNNFFSLFLYILQRAYKLDWARSLAMFYFWTAGYTMHVLGVFEWPWLLKIWGLSGHTEEENSKTKTFFQKPTDLSR